MLTLDEYIEKISKDWTEEFYKGASISENIRPVLVKSGTKFCIGLLKRVAERTREEMD